MPRVAGSPDRVARAEVLWDRGVFQAPMLPPRPGLVAQSTPLKRIHVHMYRRNVFFDFFKIKTILYLFAILI